MEDQTVRRPMKMDFIEATEKAIHQLVTEFRENSNRFYNERDLHWSLYHCLSQQGIFQGEEAIKLIRAEFATHRVYRERRPARGHFDLVVLEPDSLVDVLIAVEVKMWAQRSSDEQMKKKIDWDIEKLTDKENGVKHAYLLHFVKLDFGRPIMKSFYRTLYDQLRLQAKQGLRILCVPSDATIPPASCNWLRL